MAAAPIRIASATDAPRNEVCDCMMVSSGPSYPGTRSGVPLQETRARRLLRHGVRPNPDITSVCHGYGTQRVADPRRIALEHRPRRQRPLVVRAEPQPEAVAAIAGEHMQVHVQDLLHRRLAVGE